MWQRHSKACLSYDCVCKIYFLKLSFAYEKFYVLGVNHSSFLRTKNGKCERKCTNGPSCLCTFAVILIVILIIIGIPSPSHSLTLGLNPSFSANPPYCSLFFFSFRFHCMDFPDCLLLLLSISVFLLFSFSVFTLFQLSVPCGRLS